MTLNVEGFVTWEFSGIQDKHIKLGLVNAQQPYKKIVINRDVDLTTKSQNWVVPTVPNGIYKYYMMGSSNFFKTSDPFSIYTQTGIPNTSNSGGGAEDNSTRNTIIGSVVGGIATIIAAVIGAAITAKLICESCRWCGWCRKQGDNLSQEVNLESGGNDSRHNGGNGVGDGDVVEFVVKCGRAVESSQLDNCGCWSVSCIRVAVDETSCSIEHFLHLLSL
nr:6577_t:CDS:2 [Entrophospora candida]